jgi:heme-degrading monooxygenase HmoA
MLVVMVRMPVESDDEGERLENRFRNRAGLVDNQPGFIGFELLKGNGEYVSMTRWADKESLDAWMQGQAHAQAHADIPGAMGGDSPSQASVGQAQSGRPASMGGNVSMYEVVIPQKE